MRNRLFPSIVAVLVLAGQARSEGIHRQPFEDGRTHLRLGVTDAQVKLLDQRLTREPAHGDGQSEQWSVRLTSGTYCYIEYEFGRSLLFEELSLGAWVHANAPGARIAARVVLPNHLDDNTNRPTIFTLRGDAYDTRSRWRYLTVRQPMLLLRREQQLRQAETKKTVDIRGAYVDMLLFDIHGGVGEFTVNIDDIHIGPIVEPPDSAPIVETPNPAVPANERNEEGQVRRGHIPKVRDQNQKSRAVVRGDGLYVGDEPFLMVGIRRTEAPLEFLWDAGFNTVFFDWPRSGHPGSESAVQLLEEAHQVGFHTVPILSLKGSAQTTLRSVARRDPPIDFESRTLAYSIGDGLRLREESVATSVADTLRRGDALKGRPVTGDVRDGLRRYSNQLDMVGAHRFPLMTNLTLDRYRQWLSQRRNIARPGTVFWTWIQTQAPDAYSRLVYGHGSETRFDTPVGPQGEQIALLAYASLAAGYRGLAFSSDLALSGATLGRERALQVALTNLELHLAEPFVAGAHQRPIPAKTSHPDVAAVLFRHKLGVLVMAYWKRPGAQFVVGQAAVDQLQVIVENASEDAHAFLVAPGETRDLKPRGDLAGTRITIPEFDVAALAVVSSDPAVFALYQELTQQIAPQAARWQKELAEIQLARTEEIDGRLQAAGHPHADAPRRLFRAREFLAQCREAWDRKDYRDVVRFATRARRLARLTQRLHWDSAVASLDDPVSNPFAVSFYTLPEFHAFQDALRAAEFGANLVPSGDFERAGNLDAVGWTYAVENVDKLETRPLLRADGRLEGAQALELQVRATDPKEPVLVAEHTRMAMVSPPVIVRPGQIVRISGSYRFTQVPTGSVDGAMVYDSIGGLSLALRLYDNAPSPSTRNRSRDGSAPSDDRAQDLEPARPGWKRFVLYRPVRESARLRVHLVMTGVGTVLFDDLSVQVADGGALPLAGGRRAEPLR